MKVPMILALFGVGLMAQAVSLFPDLSVFRVEKAAREIRIWSKNDCRANFFSAPDQTLIKNVEIRAEDDALVIDTEKAFQAGVSNLNFNFNISNPDDRRMGEKELTVMLSGPKGATVRLFFEGYTVKDQHFARYQEVELNGEKQIFSFQNNFADDMKSLHLRFDVKQGGIYKFYAVDYETK